MRKLLVKGVKLVFVFALFGTLGLLCFSEGTQVEESPLSIRDVSYSTQSSLDTNSFMSWNTFVGSSSYDEAYAVALDGSGNIYVAGERFLDAFPLLTPDFYRFGL